MLDCVCVCVCATCGCISMLLDDIPHELNMVACLTVCVCHVLCISMLLDDIPRELNGCMLDCVCVPHVAASQCCWTTSLMS